MDIEGIDRMLGWLRPQFNATLERMNLLMSEGRVLTRLEGEVFDSWMAQLDKLGIQIQLFNIEKALIQDAARKRTMPAFVWPHPTPQRKRKQLKPKPDPEPATEPVKAEVLASESPVRQPRWRDMAPLPVEYSIPVVEVIEGPAPTWSEHIMVQEISNRAEATLQHAPWERRRPRRSRRYEGFY